MINNGIDISIIVPMHNEEGNVQLFYQRTSNTLKQLKVSYEIIFINDGSKDNTQSLIYQLSKQDEAVKYIDLSKNFGHQIAVSAGLAHASGNAVVIIDADLQDPPELISLLYHKFSEGYDVVYAKRKKRQGESAMKLWTASLFYRLLKKITNVDMPLDTGDFRIISKRIVKILTNMPERNKFLRGQISWVGYNQSYVEYDREARQSGDTSYTYSKMIRFALDGITSFSDIPLRLVTYLGLFISVVTGLLTLYALYSRFISKIYTAGWTSLMIVILFFGGVQMIAIGIIGEYLSRMNDDIRQRPLFLIKETNLEGKSTDV